MHKLQAFEDARDLRSEMEELLNALENEQISLQQRQKVLQALVNAAHLTAQLNSADSTDSSATATTAEGNDAANELEQVCNALLCNALLYHVTVC
jgi:predicted metal-dependent enzyme (double-stranded beta helix superfamily)